MSINITPGAVAPALIAPTATALTGTVTGTANGVLEDIAAAAGACAGSTTPSAAQVDAAIATAVAPIVAGLNLQVKELMTKINALVADNAAMRAVLVANGWGKLA